MMTQNFLHLVETKYIMADGNQKIRIVCDLNILVAWTVSHTVVLDEGR